MRAGSGYKGETAYKYYGSEKSAKCYFDGRKSLEFQNTQCKTNARDS